MYRSMQRARLSIWQAVYSLIAVLVPFLLAIPVIHHQAHHRAQDRLRVVNNLVISHAENIVEHARQVAREIAPPLVGLPCAKVMPILQGIGALRPYLRTISLIDKDVLYCSSIVNLEEIAVDKLIPGVTHMLPGLALSIVPATPLVKTRPALFLLFGFEPGRGVLACIDGQYLNDIIYAASQGGHHTVQLRIGTGAVLTTQGVRSPHAIMPQIGDNSLTVAQRSTAYPIEAMASLSAQRLAVYRNTLWLQSFPFLAVASGLFAYLVHRLNTRRMAMATEIQRGIRRREFCVQYQPIIDLTTGVCVGAEALIRWQHPGYGLVQPELFFPLLEDSKLAMRLTRHLLYLIEQDLGHVVLPRDFLLSINLHAEHLCHPDLMGEIERFLHSFKMASPKLMLELTERRIFPDALNILHNMRALRAIGIAFAIDDFGSGHSSLAFLEKITVDFFKIDRGFISIIDTDAVNAPVLELIIALGARLGVNLIGEGIETPAQANYLRAKGVKFAQGGLFSPPLTAASLRDWL